MRTGSRAERNKAGSKEIQGWHMIDMRSPVSVHRRCRKGEMHSPLTGSVPSDLPSPAPPAVHPALCSPAPLLPSAGRLLSWPSGSRQTSCTASRPLRGELFQLFLGHPGAHGLEVFAALHIIDAILHALRREGSRQVILRLQHFLPVILQLILKSSPPQSSAAYRDPGLLPAVRSVPVPAPPP